MFVVICLMLVIPTPRDYLQVESELAGNGEVRHPGERILACHLALIQIGVREDWLEPWEIAYRPWADAIDYARYADLTTRDCPPTISHHQFPDNHAINLAWKFNRCHKELLLKRIPYEMDREAILRAGAAECDWLGVVWDWVYFARMSHISVMQKRLGLKRLRDYIGPEQFDLGVMPPLYPLWTFEERR